MNWKYTLPLALLLMSSTIALAGRTGGGGSRGGGQSSGDSESSGTRGSNNPDSSRQDNAGRGQGGVSTTSTTINAANMSVGDFSRVGSRNSGAPYRVGLNMIRTKGSGQFGNASGVLADIAAMGGQGIRQIQEGDLTWFNVTPKRGNGFTFDGADTYLRNDLGVYPIPTLFQIGPATAATHWNKQCPHEGASESQYCREPYTPQGEVLNLGDRSAKKAATTYLDAVSSHYRDSGLRHFEVMNEPERFKHYDLAFFYMYRWGPSDYAELLKLSSKKIKANIPNARIVAGGMVYYNNQDTDGRQEMWEDFFDKTLSRGAGQYIDVVNFHYYGAWGGLEDHIGEVRGIMRKHGIGNKPIWMTEVGSSATKKSEMEQARDVFRFFTVAFGNGVELANWHTHISSSDSTEGWGGYGTRASGGRKNKSWYTYKLFSSYLGNFGECTPMRQGKGGVWAYRYSGALYSGLGSIERSYVIWSSKDNNSFSIADDVPSAWREIEVINVVPGQNGSFNVTIQSVSDPITVGQTPVLVVKH